MTDTISSEEQLYYLQDKRQYVGNSMLWWGQGRSGYVCDIRKAQVFTKEEAFAQHRMRETDIPWPKSYIDARISHHIDMQHCKREEVTNTPSEASKVAGVKDAGRSTGPYTADNGHSNSVAAAGHSSACAHEGYYYCKKCGKDLTPEIQESHGRYNDSPGSARSVR